MKKFLVLSLLLISGTLLTYISVKYDFIIIYNYNISTLPIAITSWILYFTSGIYISIPTRSKIDNKK